MKCLLSFLFSMILLCFYSCSEFCAVDCIEENSKIDLRIVSSIDSTDLIFSENSTYDIGRIKIFNLSSGDTTFFNIGQSLYDSTFTFDHVNFMISRIFIDFGDLDIDTLDVNFGVIDGECCGTSRFVSSVLHNNSAVYNRSLGDTFAILVK